MAIYKSKGKKDGLQKYRVFVNYTDNTGKYKKISRTAYGLDTAKMVEMQLQQDVKNDDLHQNKRKTIQNLADEYIEYKKSEIKGSSLDNVKKHFRLYILPKYGDYRIDKFTPATIQEWKNMMNKTKSEKTGDVLALKTLQEVYKGFSAMFNFAEKMGYINKSPFTKTDNFKRPLEVAKDEMDFYTPSEFEKFIDVARTSAEKSAESGDNFEYHFYVFFCIAFFTGMRKGEIHALRWCDISDNFSCIHVTRSLNEKRQDEITSPKNKSSVRTIVTPVKLQQTLQEHYDRCKQVTSFADTCFVCGGIAPLRDTTIQHKLAKYAAAAGVKTIRVHDFRHSHASYLINSGVNILAVSKRLGHSTVTQTLNTYAHLYPDSESEVLQALNRL